MRDKNYLKCVSKLYFLNGLHFSYEKKKKIQNLDLVYLGKWMVYTYFDTGGGGGINIVIKILNYNAIINNNIDVLFYEQY